MTDAHQTTSIAYPILEACVSKKFIKLRALFAGVTKAGELCFDKIYDENNHYIASSLEGKVNNSYAETIFNSLQPNTWIEFKARIKCRDDCVLMAKDIQDIYVVAWRSNVDQILDKYFKEKDKGGVTKTPLNITILNYELD